MLQEEIIQAKMSPAELSLFRSLLLEIGATNGSVKPLENQFIGHLFPSLEPVDPAPIQSLWGHSELVITACVYVAVLSGRYPVEKARMVSKIAHVFGFSARKLRKLEEQALRTIQYKGQHMSSEIDIQKHLPPDFLEKLRKNQTEGVVPTTVSEAKKEEPSYADFMRGLWQSDMDLIQHTEDGLDGDEDTTKL